MPGSERGRRSQTSARYRRRRALVVAVLVVIAGGAVAVAVSRLDHGGGEPQASSVATGGPQAPPRLKLVAKEASASLPSPVSGESTAAIGGAVYVMGGLDGADNSLDGILRLDPKTSRVQEAGNLTGPVHDA